MPTGPTAAYAADAARSRGRRIPEPTPPYRSEYQRDRDRIVHCSAFRRLEYKTQVFVNHEGDLFRTRLTHSIEVAQIARSAARALGLDEDLVEAISLAHDLGHTPFGHAGQEALNRCMKPFGGFEHNLQSLRVVDVLEERYAEFDGLNLMFETREGILKHCARPIAEALGEVGRRFLDGSQPSLEAQLANLCDEIAYNNHDVDDGLRSHLIHIEQLLDVELFRFEYDEVKDRHPQLAGRRLVHEVIRRMINRQVTDLIETTRANIEAAAPRDIDAVRAQPRPLVAFSDTMRERHEALKRFLHRHLYRHHRVHRMTVKAQRLIQDMFEAYMDDPRLLPESVQAKLTQPDPWPFVGGGLARRARVVADYIAGMTDRYAIAEHDRLFDPKTTH
ncbi:MAG: deoxyguanosinetriphosphate triphosphohydrolase-like protein [Gammaproteobacteria bacterium]|nr:MAG: deoxyguanosinetriphosphate triphosphohydrolase-like protein [Gammaproteobacteria bacterium]